MAKIIAFEGIDGSGKTLQFKILSDFLRKMGKTVKILDFPNYDGFIGSELGALLRGKNNINARTIDAKSMALWFALDRFESISGTDMLSGDFILINRYTLSNAVYQSVRGEDIVDFILKFEHDILKLPKPDAYIYLAVDPVVAQKNVLKKKKRRYLGNETQDVYEASRDLQLRVFKKYEECAAKFSSIIKIQCVEESSMKSKEKIANMVVCALKEKNII
ncbi:MAG: hypothetical protein RR398_01330 [Clostridia bacterium]